VGSLGTRGRTVAFGSTMVYVMAISAYTNFLLGMLGPLMIGDLGISRTQFGLLNTVIYVIGGLGAPLLGPLVDSLGGRRVLVLLFLAGGTSWFLMGWAPSFGLLVLGAAFAGFVRGSSNLVGNKLVATHATPQQQGLIMGISKSGAQVGAFAIGVLVPPLALAYGWRGVMYGSVALAVVGLVAAFVVIPPDGSRQELKERHGTGSIAGNRTLVIWLGINAGLIGMGSGPVSAYIPLFAVEDLGMTVGMAGAVVSAMAAFGIAARILWGKATDLFRTPQHALMALGSIGVVSMVMLALAPGTHWVLLWLGAIGFTISAGCWITVGMLTIIREAPIAVAGRVSGLILACFYGGLSFGPIAFGAVVDATGSYPLAWSMSALAYVGAVVVALRWVISRGPAAGGPATEPAESAREA
jgi:predicted MFS family arabinose efflux permease